MRHTSPGPARREGILLTPRNVLSRPRPHGTATHPPLRKSSPDPIPNGAWCLCAPGVFC